MKALIVNGSPRARGTTSTLVAVLSKLLESKGYEIDRFDITFLKIEPCSECLSCLLKEGCIIIDPMIIIYERLKQADLVILATPVFFSGPTAQMKAFIDRLQAFWAAKNRLKRKLRNKKAATIGLVVGARGSEIDERNTVSIFKAAADAFEGEYLGTFSYLKAENPQDLPPEPVLRKELLTFLEGVGLIK
jgi:multimeric flavodoxin WrbA